jgi:hypothetical protein
MRTVTLKVHAPQMLFINGMGVNIYDLTSINLDGKGQVAEFSTAVLNEPYFPLESNFGNDCKMNTVDLARQLYTLQVKMQALICRREGMVAANALAHCRVEYPAYHESDFEALANEMKQLLQEMLAHG